MDSSQDMQDDKAVSRSGRVRKKSSKLNDFFESPEEAVAKPKRGSAIRPARKAKATEYSNSDSSEFDDDDDGLSDVDLKGVVGFENQWEELDESSDLLGSKNDSDEDILRMADTSKSSYSVQGVGASNKKKSHKKKQNRKDKGLADSFLRRSMATRKSTSNLKICEIDGISPISNSMDDETDMSNGSQVLKNDMQISQTNETSLIDNFVDSDSVLPQSLCDSNNALTCAKVKRKCKNDRSTQLRRAVEALHVISKRPCISPAPIEENECSLFGKLITAQMKNLPQREIIQLQADIYAMITSRRMALME